MSFVYRAADEAASSDIRSGGKIVRQRRLVSSSRTTPYDRPQPRPATTIRNSNWLSTAGRVLVSGAGKLISTVIGSDTSSSGSYDEDVDGQEGHLEAESRQVTFTSESKQKIEELIKQEIFSREECDAMIQIIRSRTVDALVSSDNQDRDTSDLRDAAVIEARKWIEERKNETGLKSHLDHGSCSLSSPWGPHIPKEAGSPVDVARTYMRVRPPWASPTANLSEIRSPMPIKTQTLTDGLSFPSAGTVLSSQTKKKNLLASGSWSIAEEMRKVRARATDELLSTPSRKFDSSGFSVSGGANSDTVRHGRKDNLGGSSSFTLALAAAADKGAVPAAEPPASTRSTALDTTGDGPLQGPLSLSSVPVAEMGQTAGPSSSKATEGGPAIHKDTNGLEGDISTFVGDFQGVPSMAEGVSIAYAPGKEGNHANTGNENVPKHTSHGTSEDPSKHEPGSSKQSSDEEPTLDASKSSPEVLLATKKQQRAKQPVRVGRGRSRGRGK